MLSAVCAQSPPDGDPREMLTQALILSQVALIKGCPTVLSVEQFAPVGDRKQPGICLQNDITKKEEKKRLERVGWNRKP